jgi:hypothetical protein
MGTPSPAQRVPLGEGRSHRPPLFTSAHHPCLGSRRPLPYSAQRGKKSVNRQALDDLKQQIPLMGYLQAHDWQPARPLSRGRWMGLCPLHEDRQPSFLVDPINNASEPSSVASTMASLSPGWRPARRSRSASEVFAMACTDSQEAIAPCTECATGRRAPPTATSSNTACGMAILPKR